MSEEKKTYNGRIQFWERGFVGVKDFDDNVIISPSLHYSEIRETEGEDVAIVNKEGKWALTNLDGKPLCQFIYDHIVYIGEHCYKAGSYVKPNNGELIVEYADTRMVYIILDDKGNTLVGSEKGYNYISEVHEGETTAAINGCCSIIDLQGNVIIDFQYKYIQPMGEGHYLVSFDKDDYYATIVDIQGNVMISADMKYRSIYQFHNHVARANQDGKWGLIDDHGNHVGDFDYNYIDEWGDGYYKAERGAKKNILRPDGTIVLLDWYHDVFKVSKGYFIFGNTIRKSKTNPKTRYIRGVAHVSGDILFPMIFDRIRWIGEENDNFYAEIGTKPYVLTLDGGIYAPQRSHLPQKLDIDEASFFENLANWVLPGLQFFYRDTNAPIDAERMYHIGDTIRAGFFADATTKLLKPAHRTRFIIASSHAARFFEIEEMVKGNPDVAKWNLATFHFNSFFKAMDVYETPLCTQVFLLHVPMSAALLLSGTTAFQFLDEATGTETSLVQMARQSLDEKLRMEFHDRSFDEEFCKRMEQPVGMSEDLTPYPLNPIPEPEYGDHIGNLIILPNKFNDKESLSNYRMNSKFRSYMDKYLSAIYSVMTEQKKQDLHMKCILYKNRKMMVDYQGDEGFIKFIHAMMLEPFMDSMGQPQSVFKGVWSHMKDLDRATYMDAVEEYIAFCNDFIPKRGERMIERIKQLIK